MESTVQFVIILFMFASQCPYCSQLINVPEDCYGQTIECTACRQMFVGAEISEVQFTFCCPFCSNDVRMPVAWAESHRSCPQCGQDVVVPSESSGEVSEVPEPKTVNAPTKQKTSSARKSSDANLGFRILGVVSCALGVYALVVYLLYYGTSKSGDSENPLAKFSPGYSESEYKKEVGEFMLKVATNARESEVVYNGAIEMFKMNGVEGIRYLLEPSGDVGRLVIQIRAEKRDHANMLGSLSAPPTSCSGLYAQLGDLFAVYTEFVEGNIEPTGNILNFTSTHNSNRENFVTKFRVLKGALGEDFPN
jgi:hypothetical protein